MPVKDYSTNPDDNLQINGINIAEGMPPGLVNNAIRQMMADVKTDSEEQNTDIKAAYELASGKAPGKFGLGTGCVGITDWNAIKYNGWYQGSGVANAPDTDWWAGIAVMHSTEYGEVTVYSVNNPTRKYRRTYTAGVWGAWQAYPSGLIDSVSSDSVTLAPTARSVKMAHSLATSKVSNLSFGGHSLGLYWNGDGSFPVLRVDATDFELARYVQEAVTLRCGHSSTGYAPSGGTWFCMILAMRHDASLGSQVADWFYAHSFCAMVSGGSLLVTAGPGDTAVIFCYRMKL